MNLMLKTSLGILVLFITVHADISISNADLSQRCQLLKCNPSTEICRIDPKCDDSNPDALSKCVRCAFKDDLNQNIVSKTLLASSISQHQEQQPLAPRLLAKSGGTKLLADNRGSTTSSSPSNKKTSEETSYDDYYAYDEDETSDKNEFGEEDEYLDDYAEPVDAVIQGSEPIRKQGVCPKVVDTLDKCDPSKNTESDCRFDTDCLGDMKCCEAACGKRVCNSPTPKTVSVCPSSFACSLNCRLGYQTDSNGCLLCECQSCPSMDQCNKNCPSGYLKDLFGCDICECSDQCPPFSCGVQCPGEVGFAKSSDGCPLCQCATTRSKPTDYKSSCQADVHCPPGFRCLSDERNIPMCQADLVPVPPPKPTENCPENLAETCDIWCVKNFYVLDVNGCPTCACYNKTAMRGVIRPPKGCPLRKCSTDCGDAGYKTDENGCRTCTCLSAAKKQVPPNPTVQCSPNMCRMFCNHGFQHDENGCPICKCNDSPQPCPKLSCDRTCSNGYRKDYSGCNTCQCQCSPIACASNCTQGFEKNEEGCPICACLGNVFKPITDGGCSPMKCSLDCKYGFERDPVGCELCSCNRCPLHTCRMFCMYGFKKNSDGCDVCECNWIPIAENIACSERIPCPGTRVCNSNLKFCESVSADRVVWFLYNFDIKSDLFDDPQFVQLFKNGLINNIASKYDLEVGQITVSSVEQDGMTSFQVMPFYVENMEEFQKKMDQIDIDLTSNEFRTVLPMVARVTDKNTMYGKQSKWIRFIRRNPYFGLYITAVSIGVIAVIFAGLFVVVFPRRIRFPGRSDSKVPIFETSYHPAPTEDDQYHAVHAPDGTAYVVVETEDAQASNDRRALV